MNTTSKRNVQTPTVIEFRTLVGSADSKSKSGQTVTFVSLAK